MLRIQNDRGIGDNQPPKEEEIPEAEPFPRPQGWDTPGRTVGGLQYSPTRNPVHADGTPWLIAGHDQVKTLLALQHRFTPSMFIFVPADGLGPLLVGWTNTADYELPPGYDALTFKGTPQVTHSSGQETGHAAYNIDEALRLAATNRFSTIYFNRSFSMATSGQVRSPIRPDVLAETRPAFSVPYSLHPYESFSGSQTATQRQKDMPPFPFIAPVYGNNYNKKK